MKDFDKPTFAAGIFVACIFFCFICFVGLLIDSKRPTALDVYRNKTELKITYINNVPVDTVVIYK